MPKHAKWLIGGVWGTFMLIYALISFPNHFNFRTAGTELAYSMQVMEYHLRGHLIPRQLSVTNPFVDTEGWRIDSHASPSVITALPFYWLGGAWGLLVHQWLMIGCMGVGFFIYAYQRTGLWQAGFWTMTHFLGMWGVYSLMGWDWHELVCGIVWMPWFWYAIEQKKPWLFFVSWLLFIGGKENFTLWGVWIGFILMWIYRSREQRRWLLIGTAVALIWFVIGYFLYKGGEKGLSRLYLYAYLGAKDPLAVVEGRETSVSFSFFSVVKTILLRPQFIWTLLFESPRLDPSTFELHWAVLWSGGWSFAVEPAFLLLLLPVYLYKLLSADYLLWGTLYHYSMEFAAILPLAVLWTAERWKGRWPFYAVLVGGALGAHFMSFSLMDSRYSKWYDPLRHRWYSREHYCSPYSYWKIHEGLKVIPREASVSAAATLIPHIPARLEYYHFPATKHVDYIALLRHNTAPWPLTPAEMEKYIDSLERAPQWEKIWDRHKLVIFRRKKGSE
ncbi:MAG: DUF2079 domain-containing protein [Bacteroidia bacterium]|nr:DUF2079 domain-containing protein [Bacteroidia bacterium]MDW8133824.1 DUF2079 domain-containing protein [Bacteroidia bacterium]